MTKIKFAFLAVALVAAVVFAPNAMAKGKSGSPQVIYTGEIAKKVVGYNGPTPVNITISNGRITSIRRQGFGRNFPEAVHWQDR